MPLSAYAHVRFTPAASASVRLLKSLGNPLAIVVASTYHPEAPANAYCICASTPTMRAALAFEKRLRSHHGFGKLKRFLAISLIAEEDDGGVLLTFPLLTGFSHTLH